MTSNDEPQKTSADDRRDLLRNPENFIGLVVIPQLQDSWTRVDLARASDGSWETYLHVRLDGGYASREEAEAVAAYYQENLAAYCRHTSRQSRVWRVIKSAVQQIVRE